MEVFLSDHDTIRAELMYLGSLGARLSGSKPHNQLVEHVKQQWVDFGMRVHEDVLHFDRWSMTAENPNGLGLVIDGRDVAISSVFPYSGTTGPRGTEKQLHRLRGAIPRCAKARGCIAVLEVRNHEFPFSAVVKTWDRARAWGKTTIPLLPATLAGLGLARARRAGVEAVIFAWRGISSPNARGQNLPFTLPYQSIPAVFVAGEEADFVLDAASRCRQGVLVLDAVIEPPRRSRMLCPPLKHCYGPTGNPEPELLYASNPQLRALVESEWRTAAQAPRVSAPNALIQFGEGQPLYLKGIPNIALVTVPKYLLSTEQGDYVDITLLDRQVNSFARLLQRIDAMRTNEIGTVKPVTRLAKTAAALRAIGILVVHHGDFDNFGVAG
ncbi:hypothetical protein [Bradyrhizobium stylosanthis]|uniref:Uncharacterized protein n=1 Tax=Bradyrhizobium stylosanthis TaxID=1803665 RepID=A0A560D4L4_9BRAD|nr:hypothetical protein [Bradyrhizobium stylosanthis]TWA92064.1 hypothetical protein FBZ96_11270 [Bradyrhizobium stylosanthis]